MILTKKEKKAIYDKKRRSYNLNKEKRKDYVLENKDKIAAWQKQYQEDNPEVFAKASKKWAANNRGTCRSYVAKRRSSKLKATPIWFEKELIKEVYKKAKWLESLTGLKYHVDHIIPLQGKNVCGLHCWANLQLLEASLNISKSNK